MNDVTSFSFAIRASVASSDTASGLPYVVVYFAHTIPIWSLQYPNFTNS
jgi:hypothetical protein